MGAQLPVASWGILSKQPEFKTKPSKRCRSEMPGLYCNKQYTLTKYILTGEQKRLNLVLKRQGGRFRRETELMCGSGSHPYGSAHPTLFRSNRQTLAPRAPNLLPYQLLSLQERLPSSSQAVCLRHHHHHHHLPFTASLAMHFTTGSPSSASWGKRWACGAV